MESQSLPEAITSILETRGWSQSRLARELGVTPDWVSKAKRLDRDPAFNRVINLLAGIGWEVVIRPKRPQKGEVDPVKRREFVSTAASVIFVPSPKVGPYEDPAHVRELARRLLQAEHEHGAASLASSALRHIRRIEPALAARDGKLQEAASELAVEGAWILNDARRFDAGENVGRLALELAKLSKSPAAVSYAYSALAALNVEGGRADRAMLYARDGTRVPDVPEAQQAWMRLRKGRAFALVRGQERAARSELEDVQVAVRDYRLPQQDQFEAADMMGNVGVALNDMGASEEAHRVLGEALSLLGASSPYLHGRFLAQQVIAALGMSEPSLAAEHMLVLTRVVPLVNSRRLDGYLRQVVAASAKWAAVPDMRTARDQLLTVTAA
jgi:transcriptional regulator with XRE-family HTH domain